MFPLDFTLYMDDSWAALGTTKLTQTFELDWAFGEKFERTKPINAARDSDSYVEMAEQEHELTLTLANDAAAKGLISRIRTGGMKFIRIKAEGPTIESAIKYSFILDLACFITESAAADEMDSIYVREFTLMVGRDATSGKAIEAKVVNKRQSL